MTPEELANLMADITNPDKQQEAALKLKDHITAQAAKISDLETARTTDAETIATLRDTNQRLFLRQAGPAQPDQEDAPKEIEDMTPQERDEYMRNLVNGKENDNGNQ